MSSICASRPRSSTCAGDEWDWLKSLPRPALQIKAICRDGSAASTASRRQSSPDCACKRAGIFTNVCPLLPKPAVNRAGRAARAQPTENKVMSDSIENAFLRMGDRVAARVSLPGDERYVAATSLWAKQIDVAPRAVVHCESAADVQAAIRTAREHGLPLSVRGGGHDWAGRALCNGIVIDLSSMRDVALCPDHRCVMIAGGARAVDVAAVTDPAGLAVVAGSASSVGMAGLTLGGGYGPLIGRFGLALDNMFA